jgi:hypothetical protein
LATRTTTQYIDDLDGTPIDGSPTVSFSLDGRGYELDLSPQNKERLRSALEPFIQVARRVGPPTAVRKPQRSRA